MANIFNRFIDSMKLTDDDEDEEDEFEPDEDLDGLDEYEEEPLPARNTVGKRKFNRRDYEEDAVIRAEEEPEEEQPVPAYHAKASAPKAKPVQQQSAYKAAAPAPERQQRPGSNVVPMKNRNSMEVCMVKPTNMSDAKEVCDILLGGKAVVINMEGINLEMAQRIVDFTSGACYAMNGNLQSISRYIFIVTPSSIDLSGDFQESPADDSASLSID